MLDYTQTTVFNTNAQTLVNTVNCVGVMGAGLALEFKLRYPEMEKDYIYRCKKKEVKLGKPYLYREYETPWILNFPTKDHWRNPSKIESIQEGLEYFANNYKRGGITSIAFPKLGCSHGGLSWKEVSPLMEKYLSDLDLEVWICLDEETTASGTEKIMIDIVNNSFCHLSQQVGIKSHIENKIKECLPLCRFRDVKKIEGVGKKTYAELFKLAYYYAIQKKTPSSLEQLVIPKKEYDLSQNLTLNVESTEVEQTRICNQASQQSKNYQNQNIEYQNHAVSGKGENLADEICTPQFDTFEYYFLPNIEKVLEQERKIDEIVKMFGLPKNTISRWLKEAKQRGKIKQVSKKPITYIAVSKLPHEQLSVNLNS